MHIISPTGVSFHVPAARHVSVEDGIQRLYTDTSKEAWVADVPTEWVVSSLPLKPTTDANGQSTEQPPIERTEKTTWFGFLPIKSIGIRFRTYNRSDT